MNRTYGSFFCYLVIRNMMLTTSVAAAIRSDSFSKSVTHITPTKGVNRHSPVAGFIIAHRFVTGKHKTEQTIAAPFLCVIPNQKLYVPYAVMIDLFMQIR